MILALADATVLGSIAAVLVGVWCLRSYLRLRHVPGPFLAAWTNIPRMRWVQSNRAHEIHVELHRKYGKLVRFGPNMVSVQDPNEINTIYSHAGTFKKASGSWSEQGKRMEVGREEPLANSACAVQLLPRSAFLCQGQACPHHLRNSR